MAADTGMDTCPSPEITDSRKRPLDGDSENGDVKRSHFSSAAVEPTYHFKVLVPSMVAGAIIGKGGETIAQLQKETGARVKMSKSHDFYPGTTERACLITGSVEGIMVVLEFIMDKIKEKPELVKPFPDGAEAKMPQDRDKQVKILVPNSTAGMIIGKGGNYIKQVKEQSGSYVQISQKAKELSLQERCITVVGEREGNRRACRMILHKVADDPQSGACPNVSYADVAGPVANYNPTGSPYAADAVAGVAGVPGVPAGVSAGVSLSLSLGGAGAAGGAPLSTPALEAVKLSLAAAGHGEGAVAEVAGALAVLAKHQLVCVSLPPPGPLPYFPLQQEQLFGSLAQVSLGGASPARPLERFADVAFEALRPAAVAPIAPIAPVAFPQAMLPLSKSPTPADVGAKDSKNVEIAEVIVGAILGPGGRSLVEIQQMSGANIQISKKGSFAPGTRNRIVTITGSPSAIGSAHYLIEQKIQEEELKRTRHTALTSLLH